MPKLFRYLLRLFLLGFMQVIGMFMGLFFLVDGIESIRRFSDEVNFTWGDLVVLLILRLPSFVTMLLPSITLLTTLIVLTRLTRQNEITVMRASGISLYRIIIPFLIGGAIIATLHMGLQDQIIPRTNKAYKTLANHVKNRHVSLEAESGKIWYRSDKQIIHARSGSAKEQSLYDVIVFRFDDNHRLVSRIEAEQATFKKNNWQLHEGIEYVFGNSVQAVTFKDRPWRVLIDPTILGIKAGNPDFLSISQLHKLALRLQKEGADASTHWVMLYRKLADPLTTIAAILLAFPFALRLPRQGGASWSVFLGILLGFAMFVVIDLSTALGLGGRLPPQLAAAAPVVIFMSIGGYLFLHISQPKRGG
ncbi:MAG: LPS export ABC transporter permease LptG [Magnetococcales bacterium]|nr:LPS export ABC transporter permease LptG [Magnetococcales bacterium]